MNNELAILGGTPVRAEPIPTYNTIGQEEKDAVMRVMDDGELSGFVASPDSAFWGGPEVRALEDGFRRHFGVRHAVSVNSATSALHCATMAAGLGPGDEVIVSPYTMSASATSVLFCGAVPVFADIEDETFGLSPAAVERAITPRTKAIMAVNIFGHAARLSDLRAIADHHNLFLIEDNAQAPDAQHQNQKTGTIGHMGIFSLNRHKTMQCGEGGVLITDDDDLALRAALVRNHGEVVVEAMGITDIKNTIGLNYRMSELHAAIARVQFRKLPHLNAHRVRMATRITEGLQREIPGILPPMVRSGCTHVYYFYVMRYDEKAIGIPRDLFVRAVQAEGLLLRAGYVRPIYLEPTYQQRIALGDKGFPFNTVPHVSYERGMCPTVERLQDREVILTSMLHPPLKESDADQLVEAFKKVVENKAALLKSQIA